MRWVIRIKWVSGSDSVVFGKIKSSPVFPSASFRSIIFLVRSSPTGTLRWDSLVFRLWASLGRTIQSECLASMIRLSVIAERYEYQEVGRARLLAGVDTFYQEPLNKLIPIEYAFLWERDTLNGKVAPRDLQKQLDEWRATMNAAVGASVAWIVESDRPIGWTLVPTFLYALDLFHPAHWARPPTPFERVGDAIRMALPAVACIVAGIMAAKRRAASQRVFDRMLARRR
jgi:hypothetical protein